MKHRFLRWGVAFILTGAGGLCAQTVPFLWGTHWGVGARAAGLGGAFAGLANDYSALFYNPAGLGQLETMEITASFSQLSLSDRAVFMGRETEETSSYTKLDAFGAAVPIPTYRGSLVLGLGYQRIRQFDKALHVTEFISTPGDSVTWNYDELDEGGLGLFAFGASMEVAPGLYVGGSLNIYSGSDDYIWRFTEEDRPYDIWMFDTFTSTTQINTQLSGFNFTFGGLYKVKDTFRIGGSIETPLTLKGKEEWSDEDVTHDDDGSQIIEYSEAGQTEYKIQAPWRFRVGGSVSAGPILLSGEVVLTDYSQLKYKTMPPEGDMSMADANFALRRDYQNTTGYRVGGELTIPGTDLRLRGGYRFDPSPLRDGASDRDRTILSVGAGYLFNKQFDLNVTYLFTDWQVPGGDVITRENLDAGRIMVSLSYLAPLSRLLDMGAF